MLYMHFRDEGSPYWGDYKAIGHWEDIQLNGDELSAIPILTKLMIYQKKLPQNTKQGLSMPQVWVLNHSYISKQRCSVTWSNQRNCH